MIQKTNGENSGYSEIVNMVECPNHKNDYEAFAHGKHAIHICSESISDKKLPSLKSGDKIVMHISKCVSTGWDGC